MGLSGPGILRRVLLPSGEAGDSGAQQGSKALNAGLCAFVAQPSDDGLLLLQAVGCFLANHSTQGESARHRAPSPSATATVPFPRAETRAGIRSLRSGNR